MRNTKEKQSDGSKVQEAYVAGLLQQIKLLELEITYLKQHAGGFIGGGDSSVSQQANQKKASALSATPTIESPSPTKIESASLPKKISSASSNKDVPPQAKEDISALRNELSDKSARLQEALATNAKLTSRLKMADSRSTGDLDERYRRQIDMIAALTTKCEQLEADCHAAEARYKDTVDLLEKQTIVSKERDHKVEQLTGEVDTKDDQLKTAKNDLETARLELSNLEKQMLDLQDKFMESSVHVMEETVNGLGNENRALQQQLKELEMQAEAEKEQKERVELKCSKFISENAEISATLAEV